MSGLQLLILTYSGLAVFLTVTVYRTLMITQSPVHFRWELAPVPHEKGRAQYGGSYLEELDWWEKPRDKSHLAGIIYLLKEVFLLKGVWENNRKLWPYSFAFHTALYLMVFMILFFTAGAVTVIAGLPLYTTDTAITAGSFTAIIAYPIGVFGAIGLLLKRILDSNMRPFNTISTYVNLIMLALLFITGLAALKQGFFGSQMLFYITSLITADSSFNLNTAVTVHVLTAIIFIAYLPFTYMIHFVAKFFTYHEIRWNDEPMNDQMQEKIIRQLEQPVSWSAPHIRGDGIKNWIDIVNEEIENEKKPENK